MVDGCGDRKFKFESKFKSRQGMAKSLLPRTFTRTFCPLLQLFPKGIYRGGAEREEGEEQKENLTQRTKGPSQQVTNHESQITVERSETQHKGTEAQRLDKIKVTNRHGGV